ncbi:MAG: hypothetical protein ABIJ40_09565 [Bacteroidota bacterium]
MKIFTIALLSMCLLLPGCATTSGPKLTPLEIQSLQTREYEQKKDVVFPSVLSVFQDLGYIVKSADKETGLITAEGAATSNAASKFWLGITNVSQTSATAFVEEIGKLTKVRLNFVTSQTKSAAYGQTDRQDQPILDAQIYNNAFERIENAIFVRASN